MAKLSKTLRRQFGKFYDAKKVRNRHLFQGRFKSVLVEASAWGLFLSRYIHLNPVRIGKLGLSKSEQQRMRAGASAAPAAEQVRTRMAQLRRYRWSSYLRRKACGLKLKELAQAVGTQEYAVAAMAVKRFATNLERDKSVQKVYQKAIQMLNVQM